MNRVATAGVRCVASTLAKTWRIRVIGTQHLTDLRNSETPFIYALWHSQILPLLWHHRGNGAALVVSGHRDAGLLADAASSWGFRLIRGSSTRGGFAATRGAVRTLLAGHQVAITPDGPRGPAQLVKPGIVRVADLSGSPILPVLARVKGAWHLGSWDRLVVPRPFAEVEIQYMAPIRVGKTGVDGGVRQLAAALNTGIV